jgi:Rrf2 family protein
VNLALSKRGDYVVRSAICLARSYESGTPKKMRQVSAEMGVPRTYVSQILGDLARADLVSSYFGVNGGYRLARPPAEVTLLEVVEAVEGPLAPDHCVLGDAPCQWESVCPLHETWGAATAALRTVLASTTLADVLERDRAIEAGTYTFSGEGHRHVQPAFAVADSVHVELGADSVVGRLGGGGSWLVSHLEAARAEGEAILVRIGPGGPGWLGKVVAVHLGAPTSSGESVTIPATWEATGPSGLFPRFEGELRVRAIDPDRSEVRLEGRYRPPLGRAGQALDEAVLTRVAHATVRSFLRRLAHALEYDVPADGGSEIAAGPDDERADDATPLTAALESPAGAGGAAGATV